MNRVHSMVAAGRGLSPSIDLSGRHGGIFETTNAHHLARAGAEARAGGSEPQMDSDKRRWKGYVIDGVCFRVSVGRVSVGRVSVDPLPQTFNIQRARTRAHLNVAEGHN